MLTALRRAPLLTVVETDGVAVRLLETVETRTAPPSAPVAVAVATPSPEGRRDREEGPPTPFNFWVPVPSPVNFNTRVCEPLPAPVRSTPSLPRVLVPDNVPAGFAGSFGFSDTMCVPAESVASWKLFTPLFTFAM